jgi:hypothetical protein
LTNRSEMAFCVIGLSNGVLATPKTAYRSMRPVAALLRRGKQSP